MKKLIAKILFYRPVAKIIIRILLNIHSFTQRYISVFAGASQPGYHPKVRITDFHKFFTNNIKEGETILDIGTSTGELLRSMAEKNHARSVGIEIVKDRVLYARKELADLDNVEIIHADIWKYDKDEHFDIITLSNVLEHLDNRSDLLKKLIKKFSPSKFIIRVPTIEKSWVTVFKKELGIRWLSDDTHKIEHTEQEFRDELTEADLEIKTLHFKWGEILAVAVPVE